jgi:alpha-amylase
LKRYRFFNINSDHYYYDDYANESYVRRLSDMAYLPANRVLLDAIKEHKGKLKVSFLISGTALDQFELYAPDVLDSFRTLADTGCIEFIGGTDAHSLASLTNKEEFAVQVQAHKEKIMRHFGKPVSKVFCNSNMLYSNDTGANIEEMGFQGVLTEGAKHILGWKSPNYVYCSATNPKLKILLRNYKLSDDIRFNFSNTAWDQYPLTADKFVHWLDMLDNKEEVVNLSLDYATFGEKQYASSGIFEFLYHFIQLAIKKKFSFTFAEELLTLQPIAPISMRYPVSWTDEERDITAWQGNELQVEAFNKLYALHERVKQTPNPKLKIDWKYLQTSDHFRFMSTKFYSTGRRTPYNPYESPYDAFINYMNVLSDFALQLQKVAAPTARIDVDALQTKLAEKEKELEKTKLQLDRLRTTIAKAMNDEPEEEPVKKAATKKTATKKAASTKPVAAKKAVTAAKASTVKTKKTETKAKETKTKEAKTKTTKP